MTTPITPIKKISYSELKDWAKCPHYHKIAWVDRVSVFEGNEYTAFGTAAHTVCEKKLLQLAPDDNLFNQEFEKLIEKLVSKNVEMKQENVDAMCTQGPAVLAEVDEALKSYFGEYEVVSSEELLMVPIDNSEYKFKGFVDAVVKVGDTYHLFDWKTCSWGWDSRRRSDKMTTYQLTLYKYFFCKKHDIDPDQVETHFALLKRTAKKNRVEIFRVTSGEKKTKNALKLLEHALYNISKKRYIKNRLSCRGCDLYKTKHCP
tara:strand:+ start:11 stop:790 length:780 start_codon:yes stop_codon:yes gene_type:complete